MALYFGETVGDSRGLPSADSFLPLQRRPLSDFITDPQVVRILQTIYSIENPIMSTLRPFCSREKRFKTLPSMATITVSVSLFGVCTLKAQEKAAFNHVAV